MKMTFQPKKRQRSKVHGFRSRMSTPGGRKVLAARRAKGRKKLSAQAAICGLFKKVEKNSKIISLKNNIEFQQVYKNGKRYANKYLIMYILENNQSVNRIGFSISKKVGNSVVRHRLARLLRESYRLHKEVFSSGLDIVIVVKQSASLCRYKDIESALLHLAKLHNIII